MSKRRIHYVLSTHWDREWYQSFQHHRYRLVQLLDRVLDGLVDGRLKGPFTCDGQAIILDDYMEVRPERRQVIEQLARERRLVIGPWYVMPDEFLVSGESLVRNLRLGRHIARSLGGQPSSAGFVCDLFGHNSQMPQIFAGFGIRGGFIWRGLNHLDTRHVRWRAADGSELLCYKFGAVGYCTYAVVVRHAREHDHVFDPQEAADDLKAYIQAEARDTVVDPILLFDGCDHQEWDQDVYAVLVGRMEQEEEPAPPCLGDAEEYEIVHSCLDDYLDELFPQAERIARVVEGELREPGRDPSEIDSQWLIPGVLSSRVGIRQANAECQTLLCHWAEPMSAFAQALLGCEYPQGFLDVAWKWLLKNHPHDSICGCSIDLVHEDMRFRFSQCRQIADRLTTEATRKLAANVEGQLGDDELRVVVFNPLPRPLDETAELTLQIPLDWPAFNEFFGFEPKPAFRIYDAGGNVVPYQRLGQAMKRSKVRIYETKFPEAYATHDIRVSLPLRIPATGYTTLTVRQGERGIPTRYVETPGLATSERSMANEYLTVTIESNGTLTVSDARTGQTYSRLLTIEDTADIGDGWYHGMAANDQTFVSSTCHADLALVHNGPMLTTFRVRTTMHVPAEFRFDSMTRSDQLTSLVIDSLVSLRPGVDRVEVQTTVYNAASDHRLRVLFPTGAQTQTYLADSPFDVVERPIALRQDNYLYRELEVETKPQQSWTAVYDDERGLAVVSSGLLESAVRDLPERPIALTLFRGTRRTVMTDGEPGGQLRGPLSFRYCLVPLKGEPDRTRLCELGQRLAAGLRAVQLTVEDIPSHRGDGGLAKAAGFLQLDGPAVITSMCQAGESLEVRLFNPTDEAIQATIRFLQDGVGIWPGTGQQFGQAQMVDLESEPLEDAWEIADGRVELSLGAKKIVTVRLT